MGMSAFVDKKINNVITVLTMHVGITCFFPSFIERKNVERNCEEMHMKRWLKLYMWEQFT